eukprot:NODE_2346_length_621_cov_1254.842657_g1881_i1.p2 GENE.NODE_2346_length_621_cov_1254.842657_g1881_i1~~NODE_2346_length_621_cov_1254.842657_g1881_i1.p2  ORF type:complete len:108 (-),score=36.55 NODE_2346_length_621_cov_1254.842657_g1881_i1:235-558(-)
MPPKAAAGKDKSKAQGKAQSGGGKAKKKKWSKGKVREKLNNLVMWDQGIVDKLHNEVPKWRVITVSILSDRLHVNGSLAREGLKYLAARGQIREVCKGIFSRATTAA